MPDRPFELVIISGKGGTGKTSITAALAALADEAVIADCDVDAPDLHLVLEPEIRRDETFVAGKRAVIDPSRCIGCGKCADLCRFGAIEVVACADLSADLVGKTACEGCSFCRRSCQAKVNSELLAMAAAADMGQKRVFAVDEIACEGCSVCAWFCPAKAIELHDVVSGRWFVSETRCGAMVHAQLGPGEANSGKLVSLVRKEAREQAEQHGVGIVLVDGAPGIGCPVIASVTGADLVLVVVEPTPSGLHDLERIVELLKHFDLPGMVCVNKWDLSEDVTARIEQFAADKGLSLAGRIRYDRIVTEAQRRRRAVVEIARDGIADDLREVWQTLEQRRRQDPDPR